LEHFSKNSILDLLNFNLYYIFLQKKIITFVKILSCLKVYPSNHLFFFFFVKTVNMTHILLSNLILFIIDTLRRKLISI